MHKLDDDEFDYKVDVFLKNFQARTSSKSWDSIYTIDKNVMNQFKVYSHFRFNFIDTILEAMLNFDDASNDGINLYECISTNRAHLGVFEVSQAVNNNNSNNNRSYTARNTISSVHRNYKSSSSSKRIMESISDGLKYYIIYCGVSCIIDSKFQAYFAHYHNKLMQSLRQFLQQRLSQCKISIPLASLYQDYMKTFSLPKDSLSSTQFASCLTYHCREWAKIASWNVYPVNNIHIQDLSDEEKRIKRYGNTSLMTSYQFKLFFKDYLNKRLNGLLEWSYIDNTDNTNAYGKHKQKKTVIECKDEMIDYCSQDVIDNLSFYVTNAKDTLQSRSQSGEFAIMPAKTDIDADGFVYKMKDEVDVVVSRGRDEQQVIRQFIVHRFCYLVYSNLFCKGLKGGNNVLYPDLVKNGLFSTLWDFSVLRLLFPFSRLNAGNVNELESFYIKKYFTLQSCFFNELVVITKYKLDLTVNIVAKDCDWNQFIDSIQDCHKKGQTLLEAAKIRSMQHYSLVLMNESVVKHAQKQQQEEKEEQKGAVTGDDVKTENKENNDNSDNSNIAKNNNNNNHSNMINKTQSGKYNSSNEGTEIESAFYKFSNSKYFAHYLLLTLGFRLIDSQQRKELRIKKSNQLYVSVESFEQIITNININDDDIKSSKNGSEIMDKIVNGVILLISRKCPLSEDVLILCFEYCKMMAQYYNNENLLNTFVETLRNTVYQCLVSTKSHQYKVFYYHWLKEYLLTSNVWLCTLPKTKKLLYYEIARYFVLHVFLVFLVVFVF